MPGPEVSAIMGELRWSNRDVGDWLSCDEGTVRQWRRETRPVPASVAAWLRKARRFFQANPPPAAPVRFKGPGAAARRAAHEAATAPPTPAPDESAAPEPAAA